jgi:hypothetical protein
MNDQLGLLVVSLAAGLAGATLAGLVEAAFRGRRPRGARQHR